MFGVKRLIPSPLGPQSRRDRPATVRFPRRRPPGGGDPRRRPPGRGHRTLGLPNQRGLKKGHAPRGRTRVSTAQRSARSLCHLWPDRGSLPGLEVPVKGRRGGYQGGWVRLPHRRRWAVSRGPPSLHAEAEPAGKDDRDPLTATSTSAAVSMVMQDLAPANGYRPPAVAQQLGGADHEPRQGSLSSMTSWLTRAGSIRRMAGGSS